MSEHLPVTHLEPTIPKSVIDDAIDATIEIKILEFDKEMREAALATIRFRGESLKTFEKNRGTIWMTGHHSGFILGLIAAKDLLAEINPQSPIEEV